MLASVLAALRLRNVRPSTPALHYTSSYLHYCCFFTTAAADIVKYLVHEARPPAALEANAVEGWTPLMIACGGGHLEVHRQLYST
jgi:ankyrin repeat protein